jgi:hypothetical protein
VPKPLRLTLARATLSARKAKGKKGRLILRSSEPLKGVRAKLKRGRKVLATGRLAAVGARSTMKIKAKRGLKKGAHKLLVTGRRANGSPFSVTLKVRVTR